MIVLGCSMQVRLHFAECQPDRREVGRVRQVKQYGAPQHRYHWRFAKLSAGRAGANRGSLPAA